jgi:DNA repair exonuclease SbcCD ATPase subunit
MSQPCEQQQTINEILQLVSALKQLPATLDRMHADFKEALAKMQANAEDAREFRTLIAQNRKDIESLAATDHEQWDALDDLGKRLGAASVRTGERIEAIEKWQAALNGGKADGLVTKLEQILTDLERRRGRAALVAGIPYLISGISTIIALLAFLNAAPHP